MKRIFLVFLIFFNGFALSTQTHNKVIITIDNKIVHEQIFKKKIPQWDYTSSYKPGDIVQNFGFVFKALKRSTEMPGAHLCLSYKACVLLGYQWQNIGVTSWFWRIHKRFFYNNVAKWSLKAYKAGDLTERNGVVYKAIKSGNEVPGTHFCFSFKRCFLNGWQWQIVGVTWWWWGQHKKDFYHNTVRWSDKIASGQKTPWGYKTGDIVHKRNVVYKALNGGNEVPGTHVCYTHKECAKQGWQWQTVGYTFWCPGVEAYKWWWKNHHKIVKS